jgi:hypothetical protein
MTRFGVLIFWSGARGSWIGEWLIILSVCVVIICATTSLLYATRERVIRLGNKQLAWTVGLIVLALFSVFWLQFLAKYSLWKAAVNPLDN